MQQTMGVAVVATQLAATDRRALSQAWYSALHFADRASVAVPASRAHSAGRRPGVGSPCTRPAARTPVSHASLDGRAFRAVAPRIAGAEPLERRSPRTDLARGIERALARRAPHSGAASFAIRAGGGRIRLIVRVDGGRTRVVAICATALRERVERALAQARFTLAARGVRMEVA
jgi:hypothetical protein